MVADFSLAQFKTKVGSVLGSIVDKKGSSNQKLIFKNCTFVLNPYAKVYPYQRELIDLEKEKFLEENYYFTREDLVEDIAELAYPAKEYEEILQRLKPFISEKDMGILLYASKVCKQENAKQRIKEDTKHISFCLREKTLYNWIRSGEVFEKDIFPMLNALEKEETGKQLFLNWWNNLIDFHPFRIFVSINMEDTDLKEEILKRILLYDQNKIYVHTRGARIKLCEKVIRQLFKNELKTFGIKPMNYILGNSRAKKFIISHCSVKN